MARDKANAGGEVGATFVRRRQNLQAIALRAGEDDADDAVQNALVIVLEEAQRGKKAHSLDKMVTRVVRFAAIDLFRLNKTRNEYTEAYAKHVGGEGEVNPAADPERGVMGVQRLKRVLGTIESMPSRRREVFLMHRVDEMTYPQIAKRIGISVKAVEKHMHLAMRQLSDADD